MSYLREHDEHVQQDGGWSAVIINISGPLGTISADVCEKCDYQIAWCTHERNSWNIAGTELTCDLCGADGT